MTANVDIGSRTLDGARLDLRDAFDMDARMTWPRVNAIEALIEAKIAVAHEQREADRREALKAFRESISSRPDSNAELEAERFNNAALFTALYELVDAIENNTGHEPSKSVYDRALDAAKEACCYRVAQGEVSPW